METTIIVLFWLCVLGVVTPYTVYPAALFLLSRLRREHDAGSAEPSVTFVISAFNEAEVIAEKIDNTLALDYPADKLQVVVISDESDDGTDEIVSSYDRVTLLRQTPRLGKSAGITAFADRFTGDIIVFSDANSMYRSDAVRHLAGRFDRDEVGYVVGRQKYEEGDGAAQESENTYWDFELVLKAWEGRLSSVVGGDGAIMAIRRDLFSPLKADDINDFVIPLRIVASGYRGVFEPSAMCFEEAAPSFQGEFRRKVRIVNRSFRAVLRNPAALNPLKTGIFSWQLFCHKVIRWFAGYLMLGALVSNALIVLMWPSMFFVGVLVLQILFYLTAATSQLPFMKRLKPTQLCYYFCLSNIAAAIGVFKVFTGRSFATWTPQRMPQSEA